MDNDNDGIITKAEIMHAVMSDLDWQKYVDGKMETVVKTIETMIQRHDKDKNGLDFLEMYTASGGKLQDL